MSSQRLTRSFRVKNNPEMARGHVRFGRPTDDLNTVGASAQFADVSESGMRLIARFQTDVQVGERVKLEFELPGTNERTTIYADVVRRVSEYEFAVRFLHRGQSTREEMRRALQLCRAFFERSWIARQLPNISAWSKAHRQGLTIAIVGALLIGFVAGWAYLSSDEYLGKPLKTWGIKHPREMFLDYYRKLN